MTVIRAEAIMCGSRLHGENDVIARLMTRDFGLVGGFIRGGRSTRLRPSLIPGNLVQAEWRLRSTGQLANLAVELVHSRGPLMTEPLPAAAISWVCALTAAVLPDEHPYPPIHGALDGVLMAIEAAPAARGWAVALVQFERLMLAAQGFGLNLTACGVTGATGHLTHVSSATGEALSVQGAALRSEPLLRLPPILSGGSDAPWPDILDALKVTGHFIARELLSGRRQDIMEARRRLIARMERAIA
jgi:DNA repair protein RecO (recombination protein O)